MLNRIKPLLFASLLLLTSCSACASNPPTPSPVPSSGPVADASAPVPDVVVDASTAVSVDGMGWQLQLPSSGWDVTQECRPEGCASIMVNESLKNATIVVNKAFTGSSEEYTLNVIREAKEHGATINSTKQVELNGHNFVLVEASKEDLSLMTWFTLQNGRCIELTCGGLNASGTSVQQTVCNGIASTFVLR